MDEFEHVDSLLSLKEQILLRPADVHLVQNKNMI